MQFLIQGSQTFKEIRNENNHSIQTVSKFADSRGS